jgi:hypothetical protein
MSKQYKTRLSQASSPEKSYRLSFNDSVRDKRYKSITEEIIALQKKYDSKRGNFDLDIAGAINKLNSDRLSIAKQEDDYKLFINGCLFSEDFTALVDAHLDKEIDALTLTPFDSIHIPDDQKRRDAIVKLYMSITNNKYYTLCSIAKRYIAQERALIECDHFMADIVKDYINRWLSEHHTTRIELYTWMNVQKERIALLTSNGQ